MSESSGEEKNQRNGSQDGQNENKHRFFVVAMDAAGRDRS